MIKIIKNTLKWLSLSNPNNWKLYSEKGFTDEWDYCSKPKKYYKHKKYKYYITNEYTKEPLSITTLVNEFMYAYDNDNLIFNETYFAVSK